MSARFCCYFVQYKGMFKECLDRAAEELHAGGHDGQLPDTGQLAERIEAAFHKHYGRFVRWHRGMHAVCAGGDI